MTTLHHLLCLKRCHRRQHRRNQHHLRKHLLFPTQSHRHRRFQQQRRRQVQPQHQSQQTSAMSTSTAMLLPGRRQCSRHRACPRLLRRYTPWSARHRPRHLQHPHPHQSCCTSVRAAARRSTSCRPRPRRSSWTAATWCAQSAQRRTQQPRQPGSPARAVARSRTPHSASVRRLPLRSHPSSTRRRRRATPSFSRAQHRHSSRSSHRRHRRKTCRTTAHPQRCRHRHSRAVWSSTRR